jgi:hypothetical protein
MGFKTPLFLITRDFVKLTNPRHEQNEVLRHARLHVASKKAQKWQFF